MSYSHATFVGNLGTDIEIRATQKGHTMGKARLAVTTGFGDRKKTTWWSLVIWGKKAENMANYFSKGNKVLVAGEISVDEWEGQDGSKRMTPTMDVKDFSFVEGKQEASEASYNPTPAAPAVQAPNLNAPPLGEIPF